MRKILSVLLVLTIIFTAFAMVGAEHCPEEGGVQHKMYEYFPVPGIWDNGTTYFTISNVSIETTGEQFLPGLEIEKATAPVSVIARTDLEGFGVSSAVKIAENMYIEGHYLAPDGKDMPLDGAAEAGTTFTINDVGVYYVWASMGEGRLVEAAFRIDSVKANYTSSKVLVNGIETKFEAYNINNNNYFKLRDIAKVLSGTEKQFDVTWDGVNNCIELLTNKPYTAVGGELSAGDGTNKQAYAGNGEVVIDGSYPMMKAYLINNNNYFKLRDLGIMLDFDVSWDGKNNCVIIDSSKPYTED